MPETPYFVDPVQNLQVAVEVIEQGPRNLRAAKAIAGLRLVEKQTPALVEALRGFLKKCEYPDESRPTGECGYPATYACFGYEGDEWWYCERHGADKRFTRKVRDVEVVPEQTAALRALLDAGATVWTPPPKAEGTP